MKELLKKSYKWALAIIFIVGVGILGDALYNLPVPKEEPIQTILGDQVSREGFRILDEGKFQTVARGGRLVITFDEARYVDKLQFEYDSPLNVELQISVINDIVSEKTKIRNIVDNNKWNWKSSTVNVHQKAERIIITVPEETGGGITIKNIVINNEAKASPERMISFSIMAALFLVVISILLKWINWKLEWVFLVVAIGVGTMLLMTMPHTKLGYDEEIHFGRSFYLFETLTGQEDLEVEPVIEKLYSTSAENWFWDIPTSKEEKEIDDKYFNDEWSKEKVDSGKKIKTYGYTFQLHSFSYLPQGAMIKLGKVAQRDLTTIYTMGRVGNLIMYCGIVFWAIRKILIGKRIMFVLALMPTAIFSMCTYSYDAFTTALTFLGVAYLVNELVQKDKKISYKNCAIFIVAFVLASFPKPVYIPMITLALFFPASKFRSIKEKRIFKGIIGTVFALMMASFMLPPILEPNRPGDKRGGDTNIGQQLRFIFARPLAYAELLITSIGNSFYSFVFGREGLGLMGHTMVPPTSIFITALLGYSTITDGVGENNEKINRNQKIAVLIISFIVMCLIWTALYLSFTPVGRLDIIKGVHGRYYLPLSMMLLLALNIKSLRAKVKENIDRAVIVGGTICILLATVYSAVVVNIF